MGTLATASALGRDAWRKLIQKSAPPRNVIQPRVPIAAAIVPTSAIRFGEAPPCDWSGPLFSGGGTNWVGVGYSTERIVQKSLARLPCRRYG